MIESVQGGYQTQAVQYYSRTSNPETVRPSAQGDKVSLSDAGRLLSSFFSGFGIDKPGGGAITVAEAEAALGRKRDELENDVRSLFLENGVPLSPEVELTCDGAGQVRVRGDHPQKDEIETLFEDNPELANDFRAVSGLSSHVDAAREHQGFAALYRQDPEAAVARYGHLFDGIEDQDDFVMAIGESAAPAEGGTEAGIERQADAQALQDREVSRWEGDGSVRGMTSEAAAGFQASAGEAPSPGSEPPLDAVLPEPEEFNPQTDGKLDFDSPNKQPHGALNFSNLTRQELRDWINSEIHSGYMTVKESVPLVALTVGIETDNERCDFIAMARGGLEGALARGDEDAAEHMRAALKIMGA
jgi:hypothetical protein